MMGHMMDFHMQTEEWTGVETTAGGAQTSEQSDNLSLIINHESCEAIQVAGKENRQKWGWEKEKRRTNKKQINKQEKRKKRARERERKVDNG